MDRDAGDKHYLFSSFHTFLISPNSSVDGLLHFISTILSTNRTWREGGLKQKMMPQRRKMTEERKGEGVGTEG